MKYYEVTVKYQDVVDTKVKKFTERYLVHGVSVTDVEATVVSAFSEEYPNVEFEVKVVKESNISRVIES